MYRDIIINRENIEICSFLGELQYAKITCEYNQEFDEIIICELKFDDSSTCYLGEFPYPRGGVRRESTKANPLIIREEKCFINEDEEVKFNSYLMYLKYNLSQQDFMYLQTALNSFWENCQKAKLEFLKSVYKRFAN